MENPTPEEDTGRYQTFRCPCDNEQACCSTVITSPNKFIVVLFWDCESITDEAALEDLESIRHILNHTDDEDETS